MSLQLSKTNATIVGDEINKYTKLYETLCTREEMLKAEDMGDFYRIPADNRDLNYNRYFSEGKQDISKIEDYHSHNTKQLTKDALKNTLLNLSYIKENLK